MAETETKRRRRRRGAGRGRRGPANCRRPVPGLARGADLRRLNGKAQPVLATDTVKGVTGLDRQKFAAANAAKRRVYVCHGNPGTLTYGSDPLTDSGLGLTGPIGPGVLPWTAHWVVFCPLMCAPQIARLTCQPHRDMEWPDWADKALVLTEHGVVGKSLMAPNAPTHAILWSGFEIDKVEVRQYDGPRCQNLCADDKTGLNAPPVYDPLTASIQMGFLGPCCARICIQPNDAPGLYHLGIASTHRSTSGGGVDAVEYPTAKISLIALATGPEACLEELRSMKAAAAPAPATQTMERDPNDLRVTVRAR